MKKPKHLKFIRQLPCAICGDNTSTEAAHVRMSDARVGKKITGMGIKPDDSWVVGLCGKCHRRQHEDNERWFWQQHEIDPIILALALWQATGDYERAMIILKNAKSL